MIKDEHSSKGKNNILQRSKFLPERKNSSVFDESFL